MRGRRRHDVSPVHVSPLICELSGGEPCVIDTCVVHGMVSRADFSVILVINCGGTSLIANKFRGY